MQARYGTAESNVDVTQTLKDLARRDVTFRMGNRSFGIDPHPNRVKTLRIYAKGQRGETRVFEYREGSLVDGNLFRRLGVAVIGGAMGITVVLGISDMSEIVTNMVTDSVTKIIALMMVNS